MITISRKLVRTLRTMFRRSGGGSRHLQPPVLFEADMSGLTIRCHSGRTIVSHHVPGVQPDSRLTVALRDLAEFEGGRDQPVTLRSDGDSVTAEWVESGIPQHRTLEAVDSTELSPPALPTDMVPLGSATFAELAEVTNCCGDDHLRYGLDCLQLRGGRGTAAATDTRHLLVTSGFSWPWSDDLLIPKNDLFGSSELATPGPVHVGRTEDHVTFSAGPWTLWLPIQKELRFPDYESIIPDMAFARTKVRFASEDRQFLRQTIGKLPQAEGTEHSVTVHCNGHMAVRSRGATGPVTELMLSNSSVHGEEVRINMNRQFLLRAAQLGLTEMGVWKNNAPVLAANERHQYVWQPLCAELSLPPDPESVVIRSPTVISAKPLPPSKPRVALSNATPAPLRGAESSPAVGISEEQAVDPLKDAEAVREQLQESLAQINRVIASLQGQKSQQRIVRMPTREAA